MEGRPNQRIPYHGQGQAVVDQRIEENGSGDLSTTEGLPNQGERNAEGPVAQPVAQDVNVGRPVANRRRPNKRRSNFRASDTWRREAETFKRNGRVKNTTGPIIKKFSGLSAEDDPQVPLTSFQSDLNNIRRNISSRQWESRRQHRSDVLDKRRFQRNASLPDEAKLLDYISELNTNEVTAQVKFFRKLTLKEEKRGDIRTNPLKRPGCSIVIRRSM